MCKRCRSTIFMYFFLFMKVQPVNGVAKSRDIQISVFGTDINITITTAIGILRSGTLIC